jgi:lysophospholipase L1-like esterase
MFVAAAAISVALAAGEVLVRRLVSQDPADMFTADPVLGFRLRADYHGAYGTGATAIPITTNAWGLRDHQYGPRPSDGVRIYVLGDSMVFGYRVPVEESFTKLLEQTLQRRFEDRRVEVINGGVPRYGTVQELELFQRTVDRVKPSLVLLEVYGPNDVVDNMDFARRAPDRSAGAWWMPNVGNWIRMHSQLYTWARHRRSLANARRENRLSIAMGTHAATPAPRVEKGLVLTEDAMQQFVDAVHRRRLPCAIFVVPDREQVDDRLWAATLVSHGLAAAAYDRRQPSERLVQFARRAGVPALDLLAAFQARQAEQLYDGVHWTPRGHAVAAEATAEFLRESGLLDAATAGSPEPADSNGTVH